MRNTRNYIALLLLGTVSIAAQAQDIHFSQFYMSPLTQNPGMAGVNHDMQALINYKDQWKSVATPYKTVAASFDMKLTKKKEKGFWAAGVNFYSDKAGDAKMGTTQGNLTAAYHVPLSKYHTLGAGVQGGFVQRSINYSALQWGNQYDGTSFNSTLATGEPVGNTSFTYADMGAGLVWNFNNTAGGVNVTDNHDLKATAGFSVFHIHQPGYSFYDSGEKLYMKYVLHGNALYSIKNTKIAIAPGFMYYRQGKAQEIFLGSLVRYKFKQDSKYTGFQEGAAFSLGGFVRTKDAVALAMLLEYSNYAIGISYDVNTSGLKAASDMKGGMEISLRFVNPNPFLYQSKSRF
jgi:type IX secretion system PorP/SprF family membrane protein